MDSFGCPKANFGPLHWRKDSFAHSLLITELYLTWSKGHCKSWNAVGFQSLASHILGFENRTFGFGVEVTGWWIRCWIPNQGVLDSKPSSGSKVYSAFILPRLMKWVPGTPGDLKVKSELLLIMVLYPWGSCTPFIKRDNKVFLKKNFWGTNLLCLLWLW